jgi:hypothetical protein
MNPRAILALLVSGVVVLAVLVVLAVATPTIPGCCNAEAGA